MDVLRDLDWSLLRAFLAVAETGSLSGAARQLAQSQPTLGRQIKQLEAELGLTLFERHARGLALSDAGARLIEPARRMAEAVAQIGLTAAGQDTGLAGTVRLTASDVMARHILPPIIADLRMQEAEIQIELVPSDASENLLFREADIAVRMYRSTQLDVITKHVADTAIGAFAAKSYLACKGQAIEPQSLHMHDLVGYDRDDRIIRAMRGLGFPAEPDWFAVRCDDQNTYWELVCAGCGIGFTQKQIGLRDARVVQVLGDFDMGALPVWLAAPEAMRRTPRIRRVWDALEAGLSAAFGQGG